MPHDTLILTIPESNTVGLLYFIYMREAPILQLVIVFLSLKTQKKYNDSRFEYFISSSLEQELEVQVV